MNRFAPRIGLRIVLAGSLILASCSPAETDAVDSPADFNGDGTVRFAVATVGPRADGGYNQALVETIEGIAADNGFEAPLIVDLIDPAEGRTELENIVAQEPDVVAIGSSDLVTGNEDLFIDHADIFWYCNCGSSFQDTPGLMRAADSGAELSLSGGYAMGLLLRESGGDHAVFLGCCDLNFEVESFQAFEHGLRLVDPTFTATYVPTGNFPFDFDNTAGATEAFTAAVAAGADAVYPFLGGAHEPIVRLANGAGVLVTTAGASDGCERSDLHYDMVIKFDAGDYLTPIFAEVLAGTASEGGSRRFTVGVDEEAGAEVCDPSAEVAAALSAHNAAIGAGEYADVIAAVLAAAYGG